VTIATKVLTTRHGSHGLWPATTQHGSAPRFGPTGLLPVRPQHHAWSHQVETLRQVQAFVENGDEVAVDGGERQSLATGAAVQPT